MARYQRTPFEAARMAALDQLAEFDRQHPDATREEREPYTKLESLAYDAMAQDNWIRGGCRTEDEILADLA